MMGRKIVSVEEKCGRGRGACLEGVDLFAPLSCM